MMFTLRTRVISLAVLLLLRWQCGAEAQSKQWHEIKAHPLVQFDWNCAQPTTYPRATLNGAVQRALKEQDLGFIWADCAFAFDLNADGKVEYFVPLDCGAVGNCRWAIFETKPVRRLGIISGQFIYVHKRRHRWPDLISYAHMNSSDGLLTTYHFRDRQYVQRPGGYYTEVSEFDYRPIPRFLKRAHKACAHIGY